MDGGGYDVLGGREGLGRVWGVGDGMEVGGKVGGEGIGEWVDVGVNCGGVNSGKRVCGIGGGMLVRGG